MDLTGLGALAGGAFSGFNAGQDQRQRLLIQQLQAEKEKQALAAYAQQQRARGAAANDLLSLQDGDAAGLSVLGGNAPAPPQPPQPGQPSVPTGSQIAKDGPGTMPRAGAPPAGSGAAGAPGGPAVQSGGAPGGGGDPQLVQKAFQAVDSVVPKTPASQSARQLLVTMAQRIHKSSGLDGPALFDAVEQQLALVQGVDASTKNQAALELKLFQQQLSFERTLMQQQTAQDRLKATADHWQEMAEIARGNQGIRLTIAGQESADRRRGQDIASADRGANLGERQREFDARQADAKTRIDQAQQRIDAAAKRAGATAADKAKAQQAKAISVEIRKVQAQIADMRTAGGSTQPDNAKQDQLIAKRDDLLGKLEALSSGGGATSQPAAGGAGTSQPTGNYGSADDVFKAIDAGDLTPEAGKKLLIDKFGYTPAQ